MKHLNNNPSIAEIRAWLKDVRSFVATLQKTKRTKSNDAIIIKYSVEIDRLIAKLKERQK